jgi:hypothetical protein
MAEAPSAPLEETVFFPHFADGGGWTTQLVLTNLTDETTSGSIQFFSQGNQNTPAEPLIVTVDGRAASTFAYSLLPRSSMRFQTSGLNEVVRAGSVRTVPAPKNRTPSGVAIFSFRRAGITVSEAGVPATRPGTAFRMYVETSSGRPGSLQTGLAIANPSESKVTVQFESTNLAGRRSLSTSIEIPANGQVAQFVGQLVGFSLSPGVLRISTASPQGISVIGLRGQSNERGDFLITTAPPANEANPNSGAEFMFPHIVDGGGFTTQFILFSETAGQSPTGVVRIFSQSGQPLNLLFR